LAPLRLALRLCVKLIFHAEPQRSKNSVDLCDLAQRSNAASNVNQLPARLGTTSSLIAATATKTAAATIAAVAAAATAITTKATSTATAGAIFAWSCFVDFQRATSNFPSVELFNRCRRFFFRRHFDEGETLRLPSISIFNHAC